MRYLKRFNEEIELDSLASICKNYYISNYTINDDNTVDIDGSVYLHNKIMDKIPLKFGRVTGDFLCSHNTVGSLTSLEGCPDYVGGDFSCSSNKLHSLEGCPDYVGGNCFFSNCGLDSLEGCPDYIGGYLNAGDNNIRTLTWYKKVNSYIYIDGNPISILVNSWINDDGRDSMIDYFNELDIIQNEDTVIMDRLQEFIDTYNIEIDLDEIENYYKII